MLFDRTPERVLFFCGENEYVQTIFYEKNENLTAAFDVPQGITALVGGGGKTTLMLQLARELAAGGARVIVTTTTHIFPPEGIPTGNPINADEVSHALLLEPLLCLGKPATNGKLGAPDLSMAMLSHLADYILVEADGAKRLPLKAPAEHEPVIPPDTRLVIAVAGLDGAGKPIKEAAFRPKQYAALCGKRETKRGSARISRRARGLQRCSTKQTTQSGEKMRSKSQPHWGKPASSAWSSPCWAKTNEILTRDA